MASPSPYHTRAWWKEGTVYQIYPSSYKSSTSSPVGDITGIISTLDYLKDLGIDIIWLSPMYASPQKDMGYDISSYQAVYPPYGTLEDMDLLINGCKKRKIRILLDLVVNHTSDEHEWFRESKSGKGKRDWYHWQNPRYVNGVRHPPNNWRGFFGGSVWEYVEQRDEYYLHLFDVSQPDLNWENEETRKAIYDDAVRFWLRRGVDGFRIDAVNFYAKDMRFPDAEVTDPDVPYQSGRKHFANLPKVHEWLQEMRRDVLDEIGEVMTIGECPGTDFSEAMKYCSASRKELNMTFDFDICRTGGNGLRPKHETWKPHLTELKKALQKTQGFCAGTDAWTTVFAENHDNGRSISRFTTDDSKYWLRAGKLLAMLFATLSGTLFIYQGQEIGMTNLPASWDSEEFKDVAAINYLSELREKFPHDTTLHAKALEGLRMHGRDNARTPMQWDDTPNAGFTTGTPWMRMHDNYTTVNVVAQSGVENENSSILGFWKKMLRLRKEYAGLFVYGAFEMLDAENERTFLFVKKGQEGECAVVALNFVEEDQIVEFPVALKGRERELLVGNRGVKEMLMERERERDGVVLGAWEGRVYLFK